VPSSIRNSVPIKWSPKGLTDAGDGTNSFPGAMRQLVNLIPDPSTAGVYIPRPASIRKTDFTGTNAPTGAGVISAKLVIGDLEYGMVASTLNPGKDEPFCYDLANDVFLPVSGVTNANTPTSPPASGDWVPPIMAQVASRIIVCHPGFPGGTIKFGWFDVSGFTETTLGNTHSTTFIDGNPSIIGVQPGMTITGSGIPANTFVDATTAVVLVIPGTLTGNIFVPAASAAGVAVGQDAAGFGLLGGTIVTSVNVSPIVTTGDTHSNNIIDDINPAAGIPHIGDIIVGPPDIPANTTVVSFVHITITVDGALDGTTTMIATNIVGGTLAANQFVSGFGIVPGTKVVSATPFLLSTSGDVTIGSFTIINLASTTGVVAGMDVNYSGIGGVAFVISVDSPTQVTISQPSTITGTGVQVNFSATVVVLDNAALTTLLKAFVTFESVSVVMSADATGTTNDLAISFDTVQSISLSQSSTVAPVVENVTFSGATITLSQAATATADNVSLTITGGTRAAPLWSAGDCDRNPLPSVPLGVAQFNGRAYFADGLDGIPFSDSGLPCRRSNQPNVQALTTNDGLSVTAIGPLSLGVPLTGGTVQALIAFEGEAKMQQITGDPATNNLAMNLLPVATGTLAPLSIFPCGSQLGTAFVSPQGLRFVRLDGSVTDPVGFDGQGITNPFQFAIAPSRICAAANVSALRITVQNGLVQNDPQEEYWFDLARKSWSGPHTFPARLIQPWASTFVMAPIGIPASLWRGDAYQTTASVFIENGYQLSWIGETVLLPDNEQMAMNATVEANLTYAGSVDNPVQVTAFDENRRIIDIPLPIVTEPSNVTLRERTIEWTRPLIFKQMSVTMTGASDASVRLGNLYMRYEILGYNRDEGDGTYLLSSVRPFPTLLADDLTTLFPG